MNVMKIAAIAALIGLAAAGSVTAQTGQAEAPRQARGTILNVNAQGVSEARPDLATVNVGVETTGATAQIALDENARRMTALVQTLRRARVAERDIQTAYVSVQPTYRRRDGDRESVIVGYHASNSVRARVRDLDETGHIMDAVVAAGGNTIRGVSFSHQDVNAQLDIARADAARTARARAELYANALGMRVQRIISVTEAGAAAPSFTEDEIVVTSSRIGGGETPIAPGELETRANVSVSFELR